MARKKRPTAAERRDALLARIAEARANAPAPTRFKYVPETVGKYVPGEGFYPSLSVLRVELFPPEPERRTHSRYGAIRGECALLVLHTPKGAVYQGVLRGRIDSTLRMQVELWPGAERDEVIQAQWPNAPEF